MVNYGASFDSFITTMDYKVTIWMMHLEKCNLSVSMPNKMYESVKESLEVSFRRDFNMIIEEYGFYEKLAPSLQHKLIQYLFPDFINAFSDLFEGCQNDFMIRMLVNMAYNCFE